MSGLQDPTNIARRELGAATTALAQAGAEYVEAMQRGDVAAEGAALELLTREYRRAERRLRRLAKRAADGEGA